MTRPGNHELAPEELSKLLGGELPSTLPLEGWQTITPHCQVDAIGPSDRHPDLVRLEVSFPPAKAPAPPCKTCSGNGVVPDFTRWNRNRHHHEPEPVGGEEVVTRRRFGEGPGRSAGALCRVRVGGSWDDPPSWGDTSGGRRSARWSWP